MISATIFPGRYIQGYEAIKLLGKEITRIGTKALLIGSPSAYRKVLPEIKEDLEKNITLLTQQFQGECCDEEIGRLQQLAWNAGCEVIIGMGGGKTLDVAKAVAHQMKTPVIIVPTIASSDAPCTALAVIYSSRGEFNRLMFLPRNPDVVLVDSKIVVNAPVRFLVAGMGDALSTMFEVDASRQKYAPNLTGYLGSMAAYELAPVTYRILIEEGLIAKNCCEIHSVVPAVEHVIEANTLLSGFCHESGGVTSAHAISNGFTLFKECHGALHGEKVCFGLLAALFLTDKPADIIEEVFDFAGSVGLPLTTADLGLTDNSDANLLKVAQAACNPNESIWGEPIPITVESVFAAVKAADAEGRRRKALAKE